MKNIKFTAILFITTLLSVLTQSCGNSHLINDSAKRDVVIADFENRREALKESDIFSVFDSMQMSDKEREAMMFLYAYMPLCDLAGQSGEFFMQNIDVTFQTQQEMEWGSKIPEREFLHFVLPVRVNNENLDSCRVVFYNELKERVKGMSMADAVLEVNHWCHEKVVYMPSDARTSSPLATVKTAYGRCGEESTFTVSALRAIGIPARQVYTPRWAHTDSNHAWVEAWVDGEWRFLGACEPEPVLDLGWFNAPASRAMLMHTKVFGRYDGPEEVMSQNPLFTEINIIDNYAPTARANVKVCDAAGVAVEGAKVEFKVYNYAEFYTVATKTTDKDGAAFLTAGKGDMLVWASKDGKFGFSKITFGKDSVINVTLDKSVGDHFCLEMDIVPPVEGANLPEVTEQQRAENTRRMAQEDSIRNAYVATFIDPAKAETIISQLNLKHEYDKKQLINILVGSRGNYEVVTNALAQYGDEALQLFHNVAEKDWRDITMEVVADHIENAPGWYDNIENIQYINTPRVSNELLTPYRSFFQGVITDEQKAQFQADPMLLADFVKQTITIDNDCNKGGAPITPMGVWKAKVADTHSRNIFFVSLARSLEIPARIDPVTGKIQIFNNGATPVDINFEDVTSSTPVQGKFSASYTPTKILDNPKYSNHFTIAKIGGQGTPVTLNYPKGNGADKGTTWENLLKNGTNVDEGYYMLVTGTRLASGGVLVNLESTNIAADKPAQLTLSMRESGDQVQVIGSFNSELLYTPIDGEAKSILSTTGRGYYVLGILGVGGEPTNHALRDIALVADEFEKWGRSIVLLFPSEDQYKLFRPQDFGTLPSTVAYGIDTTGEIQAQIASEMKLSNQTLPIFIIADTFNRVVYISQGYTIGLGEQILKTINKL